MKEEKNKRCHCGPGPAIQVVYFVTQRAPKQATSQGGTSFTNHAFTLIELLVVVLIIGILGAIAVPQYQKAVQKAKMTEMMARLKAIGDTEKMYYLANGEYTNNISLLGEATISPDSNWRDFLIDSRGGVLQIQIRAIFLTSAIYLIYQLPEEKFYCSQGSTAKNQNICQQLYGNTGKLTDPTNSDYEMYPISQ